MKKLILLSSMCVLAITSLAFSQTLNDYISEVKGDTLVVKDYYDMDNELNSLYQVLTLDIDNVPEGRVYELKTNGYYPLVNNPVTLRNTIIAGEDNTRIVINDNASATPPLICGAEWGGGSNQGSIYFSHDLIVKNCCIVPASAGNVGWNFFYGQTDGVKLTLENCLLEQTRWVLMNTSHNDISWHIKDCYFVNLNDNNARRSGGVLHIFTPQDTLLVENSTHIMTAGYLYRFWQNPFKQIIFNHNTFVNCANVVFQDYGFQSEMAVTNNIFINCNVKPYIGIGHILDPGEYDIDYLPVGIVNVYPDTGIHVDRRFIVDNNVVYWDSRLKDIPNIFNDNQIDGSTDWVSQMITMNQRTYNMFDDDESYPYLSEGTWWYSELPNFVNAQDLLTNQVDILKEYVIAIMDTSLLTYKFLPDWRIINTGVEDIIYSDWPIPVDLSYDNASLINGGTGGFPVGDLNWFPAQKAAWLAQRTTEYNHIFDFIIEDPIVGVENDLDLPVKFQLWQNYPNPFNPSTTINYQLSAAGDVTLKVYDSLGQEIATLVNEKQNPGTHHVPFDGSSLTSGIYVYRLIANGYQVSKKMLLLK